MKLPALTGANCTHLALQDCEYAFVLDRPKAKLPGMGEEVKATPDKVRCCSPPLHLYIIWTCTPAIPFRLHGPTLAM